MLIFHMTVPCMDESESIKKLYGHPDDLTALFDVKTEPRKHILLNLRFGAALPPARTSLDFPN